MTTTRERLERAVADMRRFADACDAKAGGATVTDIAELNKMGANVRALTDQIKGTRLVQELSGTPGTHHNLESGTPSTQGAGSFAKSVLGAGFSLKERPRVEVDATAALGIKAPTLTGAAAATWNTGGDSYVPLPADRRFIFPLMPTTNAGEATGVTDFKITARTLTGTVKRDVDALTDKATLDHTIIHSVEEIPQHAVVIDEVPNQLLESVPALGQMLEQEGRLAVMQSIDAHVYAQLTAAEPFGSTGTGLIAQIRNAVAAMRTAGMNPDLLIVDPADAVALDLTVDTAGSYLFDLDSANTSSPLFGLRIVESVAAVGADPLLVDTTRIGQLYLGTMRVEADPYTGFKKNLTDLRVETNALMHVRDANAAYRIGA